MSKVDHHDSALMSSIAEFQGDVDHECFDVRSSWPRRLLDVRSMRSCKWQPGNTYGDTSNPKYSVLSYTWGRWRINRKEPSISCIDIKGIPWEVPSVDPTHFNAPEFEQVLQFIATKSRGQQDGAKDSVSARSPFIWLDVACIPQHEHSAIANSEIGRQAKIFRGAQDGYIWLITIQAQELEHLFAKVWKPGSTDWKLKLRSFSKILTDPWFTSMWTLQESYLHEAAYIVTKSGIPRVSGSSKFLDLLDFRALAERFSRFSGEPSQHGHYKPQDDVPLFKEQWFRTGLSGPFGSGPMHVMASSAYRTCGSELDRVYGIMQIFGDDFTVGESRDLSASERHRFFTLQELEDELGQLLLERLPVISQFFVHEEPPLAGRAWRVCGKAFVPTQLAHTAGHFNQRLIGRKKAPVWPNCLCSFSTQNQGSTTWGTFKGKVCAGSRILEYSTSLCSHSAFECRLRTFLDTGSKLPSDQQSSPSFVDLNEVVEHFGQEALAILLIAAQTTYGDVNNIYIMKGLIFLRPNQTALSSHRGRRN